MVNYSIIWISAKKHGLVRLISLQTKSAVNRVSFENGFTEYRKTVGKDSILDYIIKKVELSNNGN